MSQPLQHITPLWWHLHPTTPLLPTMSPSRTTSQSTMSTGQLVMPAWTTLAMRIPLTPSSAAPASPSPPACTLTLNPDVRRIAFATTEGTDLRELASSAPTGRSSISTCSGASSGTQWTAARPSPSTVSMQTPCSTPTSQNPSWTSTATSSHLPWWLTRTLTMQLSTTLLLTMQPPSTTPHPSIPWQSHATPLPSMLHQLSTMRLLQSTMQLHQSTMQLLLSTMQLLLSMQSMHLLLLLSMQLLQSATVSHLSQTLESRRCRERVQSCDYLSIYCSVAPVSHGVTPFTNFGK